MGAKLEDVSLADLDTRFGQFSLFHEPAFQLQFPTPVSPLQAGVMMNFVHWTMPQLGPTIVEFAAQGAVNYLDGQGWQLAPALNGESRLAKMRWLSFTVGVQMNLTYDENSRSVVVEPAGTAAIVLHCVLDRGCVCRPRR